MTVKHNDEIAFVTAVKYSHSEQSVCEVEFGLFIALVRNQQLH